LPIVESRALVSFMFEIVVFCNSIRKHRSMSFCIFETNFSSSSCGGFNSAFFARGNLSTLITFILLGLMFLQLQILSTFLPVTGLKFVKSVFGSPVTGLNFILSL